VNNFYSRQAEEFPVDLLGSLEKETEVDLEKKKAGTMKKNVVNKPIHKILQHYLEHWEPERRPGVVSLLKDLKKANVDYRKLNLVRYHCHTED